MIRIPLVSALVTGTFADDESSLLQANAGKKKLQSTTASQLVEELSQSPITAVARVLNMDAQHQQNLLQHLVTADAASLSHDLEAHKVAVAMAIRRSPVPYMADGTPQEWVSALQQHGGSIDSALSQKKKKDATVEGATKGKSKLRSRNDDKTKFDATVTTKNTTYSKVGGRCRTGQELADIEASAVCEELCNSTANTTGCVVSEVEKEGKKTYCKRFTVASQNLTFDGCKAACTTDANCTGIEFEEADYGYGECEIHINKLKFEGSKNAAGDTGCHVKDDAGAWEKKGERCRDTTEIKDMTMDAACDDKCDNIDGCVTSEYELEDELALCKFFPATLNDWSRTTLRQCSIRCGRDKACSGFEWDNGKCELHDSGLNVTLSAAEEDANATACYTKNSFHTPTAAPAAE
jgi:hypothetical protein